MNKRLAIVTQTYGADINECRLLSKSIDKFVPKDIEHHIFINDEDFGLFQNDDYFRGKFLHLKSEVLPRYLFRFPCKLLGHHYHISPFTMPVREWIIQQICKLGALDVLSSEIDAIMNIDSESLFIKPFDESIFVNDDKFLLFKENFKEEPNHVDYCIIGKKLLSLSESVEDLSRYCYQSAAVIFERENLNFLKNTLCDGSLIKDWKIKLCNTYRFSEYYLYGLCCNYLLDNKNHFISTSRPFPMINISNISIDEFEVNLDKVLLDNSVQGIWLQKHKRNNLNHTHLEFEYINKIILDKIL